MTITVIAANRMGILSRLAVALGRADLRIERQSRSELEDDRVSFVFEVAGSEPATLGETLRGIAHVLEVTVEGDGAARRNVAQPAATSPAASQPAASPTPTPTPASLPQSEVDALSRSYPDLVSGVRSL